MLLVPLPVIRAFTLSTRHASHTDLILESLVRPCNDIKEVSEFGLRGESSACQAFDYIISCSSN